MTGLPPFPSADSDFANMFSKQPESKPIDYLRAVFDSAIGDTSPIVNEIVDSIKAKALKAAQAKRRSIVFEFKFANTVTKAEADVLAEKVNTILTKTCGFTIKGGYLDRWSIKLNYVSPRDEFFPREIKRYDYCASISGW